MYDPFEQNYFEMLSQHYPICIGLNGNWGMLTQHFVMCVTPPLTLTEYSAWLAEVNSLLCEYAKVAEVVDHNQPSAVECLLLTVM